MRGLCVAAVGFAVLGSIIRSASGDFTPVSQSRSVKATVSGIYIDANGVAHPPMADQTQSAPDDSPFNGAVTNGFGFSPGVIGGDVSDASQTSQIGSTLVTATGAARAQAAEYTPVLPRPFQYDYGGT